MTCRVTAASLLIEFLTAQWSSTHPVTHPERSRHTQSGQWMKDKYCKKSKYCQNKAAIVNRKTSLRLLLIKIKTSNWWNLSGHMFSGAIFQSQHAFLPQKKKKNSNIQKQKNFWKTILSPKRPLGSVSILKRNSYLLKQLQLLQNNQTILSFLVSSPAKSNKHF